MGLPDMVRSILWVAAFLSLAIAPAAMAQETDDEAADTGAAVAEPPAGGLILTTGAELEFTFPSDGTTQELSAYVEAETGGLYGGVWALVAKDSEANEVDLYVGYRGELESGFSYDVSYTRYFYPNDGGDCCGEVGLVLGQPINDALGLTLELTVDPASSIGTATVGAEYLVNERLAVSANYGLVELGPPATEREWDVGVTHGLSDTVAVDVRYYDGSEFDGYVGLSLTYDTTLLGG
jgi:uncharacterized protein (TIGR02001 family)